LAEGDVRKIIERIEDGEGLKLDDKARDAVVYVADGDARKAINVLQGASGLGEKRVGEEDVFKVASRARPKEVGEMVRLALKGDFLKARGLLDELMLRYGLSGEDVIAQVYKEVVSLDVADEAKIALVERVGEYDFRIGEGANERVQLEALLAQLALAGKNSKC
jgi:replication factor C small subunit